MIVPVQTEMAQLLARSVWPAYTKEHEGCAKYLYNQIFGLPEEVVPEKLFLLFSPNEDGDLKKQTLPNSIVNTVRSVLVKECEDLNIDELVVTDKAGHVITDLDIPLFRIPDRIIIIAQ